MKKGCWIFLFVLLAFLCQPMMSVAAVSEEQEKAVSEHCDSIKKVLKNVQKDDARARVYLGSYYEAALTKFIMSLNVRLVENNLPSASLVENQNKYADTKALFISDFVNYQQELEELVSMDCQKKPKDFYEELEKVRKKRKIVEQDTLKMQSLMSEHVKLVNQLKGKL